MTSTPPVNPVEPLPALQSIGLAITVLREAAAVHKDIAKQLADLQHKTESLAAQQSSFSHTTRTQLKQVFDALRQLMVPPDPPKRPIGFVTPPDKSSL
jgi:hypothetical protein